MNDVIVTRHHALVQLLIERGLCGPETPVVAHATIEDVRGRHVYGVLPMNLAAEAATVTEVPMSIPAELRGKELDIEQTRAFAGPARTYVVRELAELAAAAEQLGRAERAYTFHTSEGAPCPPTAETMEELEEAVRVALRRIGVEVAK